MTRNVSRRSNARGCPLTKQVTRQSSSPHLSTLFASQRRVLGHANDIDLVTQRLALLPRQAKVQHIARVVCDAQNNTLVRRHVPDPCHDLLCARRRKNVTANSCRQHAISNKARPCGLVARATARNNGHLVWRMCGVVDDAVCHVKAHEGIAFDQGAQHVDDHALWVREEVLPRHFGNEVVDEVWIV